MASNRNIGIALSGGGHRATAYGLGAMLAVVDAGLNTETLSMSSVSGGSIANAVAMIGPDFGSVTSDQFEKQLGPALDVVANRGLLLGGAPVTKWYVRTLIGSGALGALAVVAGIVVALFDRSLVAAVCLVAGVVLLAVAWMLLRRRSQRTERAIDIEVLGGTKMTLADVKRKGSAVHHVICTTELQSGEPFYFTNRGVYNYRFKGSTADVALPFATVVQASACVPGAFDPRSIPLTTLGLNPLTVPVKSRKGVLSDTVIDAVVLDDGGVYDNMADEWEYGYPNRADNWPELGGIQPQRAGYLIIVNGSGGWNRPRPIPRGGLAQEVQGLMRAQGVQYDVSTTHRRRALYSMFRAAESLPAGAGRQGAVDGIFAQITDSPYRIPQDFGTAALAKVTDEGRRWSAELARRADAAVAFLDAQGYTPEQWSGIVERTSGTATTLERLGKQLTAELVEHGYVLTMVLLHVLDDKAPLRPVDRQRFVRMCG